jgi:hypothetical protein
MLSPYWPEPYVPHYRAGRFGSWEARQTPLLKNVPGYFTPTPQQPRGWKFKKDDVVWMSLTRMEVESQMMHIAAAKGHVVIGGLGMGFALFNIARKPEVTKITLLEVDPEVIQLVDKVTNWTKWQGYDKIELVVGDARDFKPHEPVDYMFLDIWPHLGDSRALEDVKTIQKNVQAASLGWWAQEFALVDWSIEHKIKSDNINRAAYRSFARDTNLPLTDQDSLIYPRLAILAVTLQTATYSKDKEMKKDLTKIVYNMLAEGDPIDRIFQKQVGFYSRYS